MILLSSSTMRFTNVIFSEISRQLLAYGNNLGDPLTFPLAPSSGLNYILFSANMVN